MAFSNKDNSSMGAGEFTPLATKLQQAWLQSQLPKAGSRKPSSTLFGTETTKAPNLISTDPALTCKSLFSPPSKGLVPPTLRSYSIKESNICEHVSSLSPSSSSSSSSSSTRGVGEFGESERLTTFLDDMLMEEDIDNPWYMDQESNAYQVMEKGFADLISDVPALPESIMFENKEKGVVAIDEYNNNNNNNNNASSNEPLDFTRLSEDFLEDQALTEFTDLVSQQLGQMCLSLECTSDNSKIAMANIPNYMDPLHSAQIATISNNRPHETTMNRAANMHHLVQNGISGGGVQHDLKFTFKTGAEDGLIDLLIRCAEAIGQNDMRTGSQLIAELRECSSPSGSGAQRMAHYVTDALVAKMSGIGAQLYTTLSNTKPSFVLMLQAYKSFIGCVPFKQITHFISLVVILNAFKGATRVHLVGYGITYGIHWPFLIEQLARQPNGPPHLRITGIVRPGSKPPGRIQKGARMLAELGKFWGVPLEYTTIVDNWENVTSAQIGLRHDEVVVVHCNFWGSHLLDESMMTTSPRKLLLDRIRSMNPKIVVTELPNASCNEPFFMSRFCGTIKYFSAKFDMVDVLMPMDSKERQTLEMCLNAREIVNILACEGLERVERMEPYWQWQRRIQRAGFRQTPLHFSIVSAIKSMLGCFNKHFGIGEDGGWFLMGWKNVILTATSVWEPTSTDFASFA